MVQETQSLLSKVVVNLMTLFGSPSVGSACPPPGPGLTLTDEPSVTHLRLKHYFQRNTGKKCQGPRPRWLSVNFSMTLVLGV